MDLFKLIDKLNNLGKPAELSFTLRIGENETKVDVDDNCGGGVGFSVDSYDNEKDPIEQPEEEQENAKRK